MSREQIQKSLPRPSVASAAASFIPTHDWEVVNAGTCRFDFERTHSYWSTRCEIERWPVYSLFEALVRRWVRRVRVLDPVSLSELSGKPMLLLCNHQVDIESVLFNFLASPLIGSDVNVIARIEHRQSWIGRLIDILKSYPGMREREFVAYLDRANPHAMFDLLADYRRGLTTEPYSLMVHVQGELGFTCREPVNKLASTLISLAIEFDFPIVPVRFVGGLPVEPLPKSIAFPIGFGRQDYVIGKPLSLQHLASLPNRQRKSTVLDAINSIEPLANDEEPLPPQQEFAELVNRRALEGFDTVSAAMIETILSDEHPGQELAFVRDYFAEKAGARSLDGYPEWERRFLSWLCGNE